MNKKKKKEKTYICTICGNKENSEKAKICCSKEMTDAKKGNWNS